MNQIVLQGSTSIPANSQVDNVLANTRIVQCPINGRATLYLQADGANPGEISASFFVNSDEVLILSAIGDAGRTPETDKDGYIRGTPVREGNRLTLRGVNSTAGALNLYWRMVLHP